jgi:muramoyltetrapeptide carboxypeptidase
MITIPPYLKPGDCIGITCPAGFIEINEINNMVAKLTSWGFKTKLGRTVGTSFNKFSGTDEERKNDVQEMLDDENINAIFFGRGGYGVVRIIDKLDFSKFIKFPKWLLGYSDITCFHNHVNTNFNISTVHAHMCTGYFESNYDLTSTQSIFDVVSGKVIKYKLDNTNKFSKFGQATGQLIGGNLALISDLIGTNSDIETENKILFIEDIGEYVYNIDRMLWQFKKANKLKKLAGLIVGGFTDLQDNEIKFGMSIEEIVLEKVAEYNFPVCFDFPVGHQQKNWALKIGVLYDFEVNENIVSLNEINVV